MINATKEKERVLLSKRLNIRSGIRESFLREVAFEVIKIILIDRGQKESEEMDMTRTRVQDALDI